VSGHRRLTIGASRRSAFRKVISETTNAPVQDSAPDDYAAVFLMRALMFPCGASGTTDSCRPQWTRWTMQTSTRCSSAWRSRIELPVFVSALLPARRRYAFRAREFAG
jgi:hypothetical protein